MWVQDYVLNKMRMEAQPVYRVDKLNNDYEYRDAYNAGRWSMMHELSSEELRRSQQSKIEQQADNSAMDEIVLNLQKVCNTIKDVDFMARGECMLLLNAVIARLHQ